jgi:hypothetical protein
LLWHRSEAATSFGFKSDDKKLRRFVSLYVGACVPALIVAGTLFFMFGARAR